MSRHASFMHMCAIESGLKECMRGVESPKSDKMLSLSYAVSGESARVAIRERRTVGHLYRIRQSPFLRSAIL